MTKDKKKLFDKLVKVNGARNLGFITWLSLLIEKTNLWTEWLGRFPTVVKPNQ